MEVLYTRRLELVPITLAMVEAVLNGDRRRAERLAEAKLPERWSADLIARAFSVSIEAVRADPETRLWGDRLLVTRDAERNIVGSVIFHGRPGPDGMAEVGYGVEAEWQGKGYASEGTLAAVEWALAQPGVKLVTATTFPWHKASLRVIEKLGMKLLETREHEVLGELHVFGRYR
jgi:RimJ/RimL family protein N-acetyltransferase